MHLAALSRGLPQDFQTFHTEFSTLPADQLILILKMVGLRSLKALSQTCRTFNVTIQNCSFCKQPTVQRRLKLKEVAISLHDLALGVLVVGWKEDAKFFDKEKLYNEKGAIYDLKTGQQIGKLLAGSAAIELKHLTIDATRKLIVGAFKHNVLMMWTLSSLSPVVGYRVVECTKEISSLLHDQVNNRIFTEFWDGADNACFNLNSTAPHSTVNSACFKTNSKIRQRSTMHYDQTKDLLCTSSSNLIEFKQPLYKTIRQFEAVHAEHHLYLEEQNRLIYATEDAIIVHNISEDARSAVLPLQKNAILLGLSYHPLSDKLLAITQSPDEIKQDWTRFWISIWHLSAEKKISHFMAHCEDGRDCCYPITCHIYLEDAQLFIAGTFDGMVVVWDTADGRILHKISLHKNVVDQISFNTETNELHVSQEGVISVVDFSPPSAEAAIKYVRPMLPLPPSSESSSETCVQM